MNTYTAIALNVIKHHGLMLELSELSPKAEADRIGDALGASAATVKRNISKLKQDATIAHRMLLDVDTLEAHAMALAEGELENEAALVAGLLDLHLQAGASVDPHTDTLTLKPGCACFQVNGGENVSLERRHAMRRILDEVCANEDPRSTEQLIKAGWPDAELTDATTRKLHKRLYEALFQLRMLGLEGVLVKHSKGLFGIAAEFQVVYVK